MTDRLDRRRREVNVRGIRCFVSTRIVVSRLWSSCLIIFLFLLAVAIFFFFFSLVERSASVYVRIFLHSCDNEITRKACQFGAVDKTAKDDTNTSRQVYTTL